MRVEFPTWAEGLFKPYRYKVLYGGRGSGKSYAVADALLITGAMRPCRILCAREFQNSLADSVLHLLGERVTALGLQAFYEVQRETIIGANGTTFIFKGVRNNVQSIKSMSGLTHLWLEEAQTVSEASWQVLIPTIREPGSEILVTFNPYKPYDPTYLMFVADTPGDDAYIRKVNWRDNPHWPAELERERERLKGRGDQSLYAHVYEGECLVNDQATIFAGRWIEETRQPDGNWSGPYFGLDFGFSNDPTAGVKLWVSPDGLEIYIEAEAGEIGLELDETGKFLADRLPGITNHPVYADNARPESISYLSRRPRPGDTERVRLPHIEGVSKGPGSVEDGIEFIKSFERVVINPACVETIKEFERYSFKVDRLTGEVLPVIVDAWNHYIDAIRYALEKVMRANESFGMMLPSRIKKGLTRRA